MKTLKKAPTIENVNLRGIGGKKQHYVKYTGHDFTNMDFRHGDNLDHIIFNQCDLTGARFDYLFLTNIRFMNCTLKKASFDKARLTNVKFWMSNVSEATFDQAILKDVHGQYVDFSLVDFLTAKVTNAFIWIGNFRGAKANPEAGFRTQKGGDGPRYVIPKVTNEQLEEVGYEHVLKCNTCTDYSNCKKCVEHH